jgi:hypothetical protein
MLKAQIFLTRKRGLLLVVVTVASVVGAHFGVHIRGHGFFDG